MELWCENLPLTWKYQLGSWCIFTLLEYLGEPTVAMGKGNRYQGRGGGQGNPCQNNYGGKSNAAPTTATKTHWAIMKDVKTVLSTFGNLKDAAEFGKKRL